MNYFGLGSTDVGPLAEAQFTGQLDPTFMPQQYFQAAYMPPGQLTPIPAWNYATSGFAGQLASLLGGSVMQAPPPGNLNGSDIPLANWVQLADGPLLPGNLFQPGTVLSFDDECAAENYLVQSVPGGVLSSTCASGGTGLTPSQMATTESPNPPAPTAQTPAPAPVVASPAAPVSIPTPSLPAIPVSASPSVPPSNSQIVTSTPGASVGASQTAAGSTDTTAVSGCFNPISSWLSFDTCLGPLGIMEWAIVAGILLYAFSGGKGR